MSAAEVVSVGVLDAGELGELLGQLVARGC
jgi:hypothetical protein